MIKMITCTDKNHVIGYKGEMPWPHLKDDLAFFYRQTVGHKVVVGFKTDRLLGKLPKRETIVFDNNLEEILELAKTEDIWAIGGHQVYDAFLPHTAELYLTLIMNKVYEGDTYFPDFTYKTKEILSTNKEKDIEYEIRRYTLS